MKLFVFEYVCGGGWPQGPLDSSLATEGGAMLHALCEDLSRLSDVHVTTTLDTRCCLKLPPNVQVIPVDSVKRRREELLPLAQAADATFIVAPELDNILARRVRELRLAGVRVVAPSNDRLEQCSNKLALSLPDVPMIPTFSLEQCDPHRLRSPRAVVKPAFGAGSQSIRVLPTGQIETLRIKLQTDPRKQWIVQPFVPGMAVSIAAVSNSLGQCTIFPVAQQLLSTDGFLRYEGGVLPWTEPATRPMQQIVQRCCERMPQWEGYVGFDFVIPDEKPDEPLLVEINPRLCTSYLGYRRLTDDNLAALMLPDSPQQPVAWKNQRVRFQTDGTFDRTPP